MGRRLRNVNDGTKEFLKKGICASGDDIRDTPRGGKIAPGIQGNGRTGETIFLTLERVAGNS